jgi:hypothetical protein
MKLWHENVTFSYFSALLPPKSVTEMIIALLMVLHLIRFRYVRQTDCVSFLQAARYQRSHMSAYAHVDQHL